LHAVNSPNGLDRRGGPKRRLISSVKRRHGGVPSSRWTCMYQSWAPPSKLYDAIHTFSSSVIRCWWKKDSHLLMNARGSDLPSNLGKSIFWNRGGRSLWCSPVPGARGPDDDASVRSCWSPSTLDCRDSMFVATCVSMAASSAKVGSAMEVMDGEGGGGAVGFGGGGAGRFGGGVVDEERLEADTRLSRTLTPKTGGPRLRSS